MSMIDIPIGPNGDLDFSGIEVIEDDLADHEGLAVDLELLELYEILEAGQIIRAAPQRRALFDVRAVPRNIGSSPFVSRQASGLRAPRSTTRLTTARGNTGHWEGPEMGWPWDHSSCATKLRGIQAFHFSKGWADIAYSSMECGHGSVFECRWYGYRTAANGTNIGNDRSYAHCALIGERDAVTDELRRAQRDVVIYFEGRGSGTEKKVHSDWKPTACNGSLRDYWKQGLPLPAVPQPEPTPTPTPTPTPGEDPDMAAIDDLPRIEYGAGFADDDPLRHMARQIQLLMFAHACWPADADLSWCDGKFGNISKWYLAVWQDKAGLKDRGEQGFVGPLTYRHMYGLPY